MDRLIQPRPYRHAEGNSIRMQRHPDGYEQSIFMNNGRLVLGRWQGIFFSNTTAARTHHADQDYPDPD